ncbi:anaerobic sulfatase maturase [Vibrio sp. HA2012]|uniref:anaerobic sulfatase maturase n=1 Tax=Vibrio sp. HA2012 TaxID=1971595 RepID=UPI000C2BDB85|nr:anaerobic sulfatase maturase [Vibrio sp. HA2012]PJC87018.1 anaerobic sulfatase maturase [Vibrio sp. HA2012]
MSTTIENFQLLSKPTSSVCNLDCEYCFYLEKEHLYPERKHNWQMDPETLDNYIKKNIQSQPANVIDFIWQGGEPTLAGLDFYRKAVELQKKYAKNKTINNFFQTNGVKFNKEWATFLKENNFLVGISVDGNSVHHNKYRKTRSGKATYEMVKKAIGLMTEHGVEFNTLTVVSDTNVDEPIQVYEALKELGAKYMQFIPLVERIANKPTEEGLYLIKPDFSGQSDIAPWTVPNDKYGKFLNKIFDYWLEKDIGHYFVMNFEQTLTQLVGGRSICVFEPECGANLALEANGDIYSCDHYVFPDNKIGNINNDDLTELVSSEQQLEFSKGKLLNLDTDCLSCSVRKVCNGGCPKHRFLTSSSGLRNKSYLCQSYKEHFSYVVPKMENLIKKMFNQ